MAVPVTKAPGDKETGRRLKTHTKSRRGCGNCKLRKVKCDESKPMCKRCKAYGTFCNYDSRYSDLQPLAQSASDVQVLQTPLCSENQTILAIINGRTSLQPPADSTQLIHGYQFSVQDLELLHKFNTRTILTLGTGKGLHVYRNAYAKLAYSHPFLLHIMLTLTIMHDRDLSTEPSTQQSTAIAFHWSRGAALLNHKLSTKIDPSERDALWACAGLLGALAFASVEAKTPEQAWPLKHTSQSDLDWLKMSEGKKEIWKIADPLRVDSVFHPMVPNFMQYASPNSSSRSELQKLPHELISLCRLNDTLMQHTNPYLASASFIAHTIDIECSTHNVGMFLSFFGCMHPHFKQLLGQRDPCALLLIAYWYVKMCRCQQWWIWRRASLECQAICRYLTRYHGDDGNILNAVRYLETIYATQVFLDV